MVSVIMSVNWFSFIGSLSQNLDLEWLPIRMSRSRWDAPDDSAKNSPQGQPFHSALKSINY
jgi:hypothetical protein